MQSYVSFLFSFLAQMIWHQKQDLWYKWIEHTRFSITFNEICLLSEIMKLVLLFSVIVIPNIHEYSWEKNLENETHFKQKKLSFFSFLPFFFITQSSTFFFCSVLSLLFSICNYVWVKEDTSPIVNPPSASLSLNQYYNFTHITATVVFYPFCLLSCIN